MAIAAYLDAYEVVQHLLGVDEVAFQDEKQALHDASTDDVNGHGECKKEEPPPCLKIDHDLQPKRSF